MALRLSLVIDGDSTGGTRAVDDTTKSIEKLEKAAKGAADGTSATADAVARTGDAAGDASSELGGVTAGLAGAGREGRQAAGGIAEAGNAAQGAAGKFSGLKIAAGAATGILGIVAVSAVVGVLQGAATAVGEYVREIFDNTPRIERDLAKHEDLVGRIGDAFKRAQGAASDYGRESRAVLTFEEQQNIRRLREAREDELSRLRLPLKDPTPTDQALGTGDGAATVFPLMKRYQVEVHTFDRRIAKPFGTIRVAVDGGEILSGFTVDLAAGTVTFDTPPSVGDALTWGGQFHVPVRFDGRLDQTAVRGPIGDIPSIPLKELRLA